MIKSDATKMLVKDGLALWDTGDVMGGLRLLDEAVAAEPLSPVPYAIAGGILVSSANELLERNHPEDAAEQYKRALPYLQKATAMAPHKANYSFNLFVSHVGLGNWEKALDELCRYKDYCAENSAQLAEQTERHKEDTAIHLDLIKKIFALAPDERLTYLREHSSARHNA